MFDKYRFENFEQDILCRFLLNPDDICLYSELQPEHFVNEAHKAIFAKMLKLYNEGKPIDCLTVATGELEDLQRYVLKLSSSFVANVKTKVDYIIECSQKYNALMEAKKLLEDAEEYPDVDVFGRLGEISVKIYDKESTDEDLLAEIDEKIKSGGKITGIATGINGIDENINGFRNGRLYVVAGRSSMGKSAFMCTVANNICDENKVGIVSLEMTTNELKQRMACLRADIPHWKIDKGRCSFDDFKRFKEALPTLNIVINDKGGLNQSQVIGTIRRMAMKDKCKIVFVDHVGLIQFEAKENIAYAIGRITSSLKALSKELNIPIVILCQINRAAEKKEDKRPMLSELRDSGRIEEDADCVILLYRPDYYTWEEKPECEICEYIIAKCRQGKCGKVEGIFKGNYMRFE